MSDFFAPSYWYGAGPDFSGLANAQSFNNNMNQQQAHQQQQMAGWNAYNPFANTPGGFGGQTDYYSGLGAAYGRATGGFGGAPGRVGTISNPGNANPGYNPGRIDWSLPNGGRGIPGGQVTRGQDLAAPPTQWTPPQAPQPQQPPAQPAMSSAPRSPFTGLGFGGNRDFLAALMRNNASPTPPALHSQNPAAANDFLRLYQQQPPQSQVNNRFGGMQPPEWSAEGITLGDKLRQQQPGIYANSPFGN